MQSQFPCPHCGVMNVTGKVFCMSCGNALMSAPNAPSGGVPTVYFPPQQPLNPPPPAPYSHPSAQTQPISNQGQPPWLQPTQAFPTSGQEQPPPQYGPPPGQATQYTQPMPYQANPQYPPTQRYQQPQQMGQPQPQQPQYDPYAPPPNAYPQQQQQYGQYGQYRQYGPPNQYINVQVTGQYPTPYGAQPVPVARRNTLVFWVLWVFATALAWAIAVPAAFALWDAVRVPLLNNVLGSLLTNSNNSTLILIATLAPLFLILGAVVGLLSGITQAIVLGWRGLKAGSWVSTTVIGWILGALAGWIVTVLLNSNSNELFTGSSAGLLSDSPLGSGVAMGTIFGGTAGAVLGIAQFLTLQRHSRRAGLWVLASPIGWAIAAAALVLLLNTILQTSFGANLNPYVSEALYGVGVGVVAGAATGAVLPAIV